jgi:hypothetical protein
LGGAIADQDLGETIVVLVMLLAEAVERFAGLVALIAAAPQFLAQLLAGMFAARKQTQRLVVGAGFRFGIGIVSALFHDRRFVPSPGCERSSRRAAP